jgi:hypothetical protein
MYFWLLALSSLITLVSSTPILTSEFPNTSIAISNTYTHDPNLDIHHLRKRQKDIFGLCPRKNPGLHNCRLMKKACHMFYDQFPPMMREEPISITPAKFNCVRRRKAIASTITVPGPVEIRKAMEGFLAMTCEHMVFWDVVWWRTKFGAKRTWHPTVLSTATCYFYCSAVCFFVNLRLSDTAQEARRYQSDQ